MSQLMMFVLSLVVGFSAYAKSSSCDLGGGNTFFLKDYGTCQILRPMDNGKAFECLQNGTKITIVPIDAFTDPTCLRVSSAQIRKNSDLVNRIRTAELSVAQSSQTMQTQVRADVGQ